MKTNLIKEKKVQIKDYEKDVNMLMLMMQGVGFNIEYTQVDMIQMCVEMIKLKDDQTSLKDMAEIKANHSEKWESYFAELNNENE
jgi:hypothetical protein